MADIIVDTYKLNQYAQRIQQVNSRIARLDGRLNSLYWKVGLLDLWNLMQADAMTCYSWRLVRCQDYLYQTARDFDNVERVISGLDPTSFNISNVARISLSGITSQRNGSVSKIPSIREAYNGAYSEVNENDRSWFAKFIGNDLKVSGSVFSGKTSTEGDLWGISTAGTISGAIFTGEAGIKSDASWSFKDDEGNWDFKSFGLSTTASASGAVAKGEVEGNVGYLHGKASGQFITGAVEGEAKMTLWDDGQWNPSLMAGVKASGSVLQGEAEAGFGTDQYGVYVKADGDVLHAEAEAGVGIGYIGKDEEGNAQYGAKAEASAMASVAQGKVKGGVTIFGIDIDVGLKGYALAAGAEAGASITTEGVTASFSGALGLGAGLDISVDWSDAEWIEDGIDWVGDRAEDVGDFVVDTYHATGEFFDDAGDAIGNYFSGAADVAGDIGDFLFG